MGRPPLSTAEKKLKGTHRPCRDPEGGEVQVSVVNEMPEVPIILRGKAIEIWSTTVEELLQLGILHNIGLPLLTAYCVELGRYFDLVGQLRTEKTMLYKSPKGYSQVSGKMSAARGSLESAMKIAKEFGLTPSSMSKIGVNIQKVKESISKKDGFLDE